LILQNGSLEFYETIQGSAKIDSSLSNESGFYLQSLLKKLILKHWIFDKLVLAKAVNKSGVKSFLPSIFLYQIIYCIKFRFSISPVYDLLILFGKKIFG